MAAIEDLLAIRRRHSRYDPELWEFANRVQSRNLENLSIEALQERLKLLDRNILLLDPGSTPRDDLPPERGWLSPWWWLRIRHWTLLEFARRETTPDVVEVVEPMPALRPDFIGVVGGGRRLLVRLGSLSRLVPMLERGRIKFTRASFYDRPDLDEERRDDELSKSIMRPGQVLRITNADGGVITPIGDVTFSQVRATVSGLTVNPVEYWFCSFSSDLDPRLFEGFDSDAHPADGCIVIFDPDRFVRQSRPYLNVAAPRATKSLFPIEYFDPHYPPHPRVSTVSSKIFRYAGQREMRLALDPQGGADLSAGDEFFVEVGSLQDVAGVFDRSGNRVAGTGPTSFLA